MHARRTLTLISLGFALATVLLLGIAWATAREWISIDERLFWVSHTQKVITTLDGLEIGLRNAGAAGRDYLENPQFSAYERFQQGVASYRLYMRKLTALTRDNSYQQKQVHAAQVAIDAKILVWHTLITARMQPNPGTEWLAGAMKQMTISSLLDHVMAMRAMESDLLSKRIEASSISINKGRRFVMYGFALCLIFLGGSYVYVTREIRKRMTAETSLTAINTSLEDRIAQRTGDLAQSNESLKQEIMANYEAREEIRDLNQTLEKRVHQRTEQLEMANKELESFSYSVSHDLRTPLRAIVGFSRMLRDRMGERLDDEDRRLLGVIVDNAARMSALIDDLLNFSRLGRTQLACHTVDMKELVLDVQRELAAQPNAAEVQSSVEYGELPPCYGDRNLLRQVWLNLLGNALKFSSKNPSPRVRIDGDIEEGLVHYRISDNGVGFDMRYYDKLFGVFQRLHSAEEFPGTGVGLAIVQRVVGRHGGRVWAEAVPGEGAVFHFTIPQTAPAPAAPEE